MGNEEMEPAKLLLPFLQRADELQKHDPLVAYYCRLFAMERGLKISPKERTKATNALLVSLMNQLEKDKKVVKLSPDDNLHVEGFALSVFAKADKQDRAGRADLNTAKTFYAASIFFEVLQQFGEMQPEIEQKQRYAAWKAVDIRKALSEGRKPVPGPPGDEVDLSLGSTMPSDSIMSMTPPRSSNGIDNKNASLSSNGMDAFQPPGEVTPPHISAPFPSRIIRSTSADLDALPRAQDPAEGYPPLNRTVSQDSYTAPHDPSVSSATYPVAYPTSYSQYCPPGIAPVDQQSNDSSYPHATVLKHSHADGSNYYPNSMNDGTSNYPSNLSYYSQPGALTGFPAATDYEGRTAGPNYPSNTYEHPPSGYTADYQGGASGPTYSADTYEHPKEYTTISAATGGYHEAGHQRSMSVPAASGLSARNEADAANYQPPPEKVAEAHKLSRFAVSALAFDDVPTAISYLKRSLELLTIPSAAIH